MSAQVSVGWSADERSRVARLVGDADADRVLQVIVQAGAREAVGYATGTAVFSTMAELRMYRIFCLLQAGMKLEESERLVAALFKLTASGARRVVSSTLARYAYELQDQRDDVLAAVLESATWNGDDKRWDVLLPPGFTRQRAVDLCRSSNQPNPESGQGAVLRFPHETYNWLRACVRLGDRPKP